MTRRLDRSAVQRFRLRVNGLAERAPLSDESLYAATWAGCQDSMPRAAIVSLHARLTSVSHQILEDPRLTQVWGPGFSAYVVAAKDTAIFTLGRLPLSGPRRDAAREMAEAVAPILAEGPCTYREAGARLGVEPNRIRYGSLTGTVALRWEGSGAPIISALPTPTITEAEARLELARRFLGVFGPANAQDYASWAGVSRSFASEVFNNLSGECTPVRYPGGEGVVLASDEPCLDEVLDPSVSGVRLLPSGDAFYLLHGAQRGILVHDAKRQDDLWTPRVWPGAVVVNGEIVGTWRRKAHHFTISLWSPLSGQLRSAIADEACSLPLGTAKASIEWDQ